MNRGQQTRHNHPNTQLQEATNRHLANHRHTRPIHLREPVRRQLTVDLHLRHIRLPEPVHRHPMADLQHHHTQRQELARQLLTVNPPLIQEAASHPLTAAEVDGHVQTADDPSETTKTYAQAAEKG